MRVYFDHNDNHIDYLWKDTFSRVKEDVRRWLLTGVSGVDHETVGRWASQLLKATYEVMHEASIDVIRVNIDEEDIVDDTFIFEAGGEDYVKMMSTRLKRAGELTLAQWDTSTSPFNLISPTEFVAQLREILSGHLADFAYELVDHIEGSVQEVIDAKR